MPLTVRYQPPKVNATILLAAAARLAEHAMAEVLIEKSRPNVPVDSSALANSGRVVDAATGSYATYGSDDVEVSGFDVDGFATGGVPTNDYVVIQHQDEALNHPNGGGPHWLEKARHAEQAALLLAARVNLSKVLG